MPLVLALLSLAAYALPVPTLPSPPHGLEALASGPAPRVAWFSGREVLSPDGTQVRLRLERRARIAAATAYDGGWLVADDRWFEGTTALTRFTADGRPVWAGCSSGSLPAAGGRVAWQTWPRRCGEVRSPTTVLVRADAAGSCPAVRYRVDGWVAPVALVGARVVYQGVFVGRPFVTDLSHRPRPVPRLGRVLVSGHGGLLAGTLLGAARTGGVVDLRTGDLLWSTQGLLPRAFSPSGELVVAERQEAWHIGSWPVLDSATGAVVREVELPRGVSASAYAWEDESHLLLAAYENRRNVSALLRVDVSTGEVRRVTGLLTAPAGFVAGQALAK